VFELPYDKEGYLSNNVTTKLDLSIGSKIRICAKGAANENVTGEIRRVLADGNWSVQLNESKVVHRVLGRWWIEAALRGAIKQLPLVNIKAHETIHLE
jgi:hypothetical protein